MWFNMMYLVTVLSTNKEEIFCFWRVVISKCHPRAQNLDTQNFDLNRVLLYLSVLNFWFRLMKTSHVKIIYKCYILFFPPRAPNRRCPTRAPSALRPPLHPALLHPPPCPLHLPLPRCWDWRLSSHNHRRHHHLNNSNSKAWWEGQSVYMVSKCMPHQSWWHETLGVLSGAFHSLTYLDDFKAGGSCKRKGRNIFKC